MCNPTSSEREIYVMSLLHCGIQLEYIIEIIRDFKDTQIIINSLQLRVKSTSWFCVNIVEKNFCHYWFMKIEKKLMSIEIYILKMEGKLEKAITKRMVCIHVIRIIRKKELRIRERENKRKVYSRNEVRERRFSFFAYISQAHLVINAQCTR